MRGLIGWGVLVVLRVRRFAAPPGFRRPTLPPVAWGCRAAVRKVKSRDAIPVPGKESCPRPSKAFMMQR
jgi:hypothetical protein